MRLMWFAIAMGVSLALWVLIVWAALTAGRVVVQALNG